MKKINIEVQHFEGCPNSPILIKRVTEAMKLFDNIDYKEIIIDSDEKANEVNFRGSPTLLINGIDFEGSSDQDSFSLSCRIYRNGLPTVENITTEINKLLISS